MNRKNFTPRINLNKRKMCAALMSRPRTKDELLEVVHGPMEHRSDTFFRSKRALVSKDITRLRELGIKIVFDKTNKRYFISNRAEAKDRLSILRDSNLTEKGDANVL